MVRLEVESKENTRPRISDANNESLRQGWWDIPRERKKNQFRAMPSNELLEYDAPSDSAWTRADFQQYFEMDVDKDTAH